MRPERAPVPRVESAGQWLGGFLLLGLLGGGVIAAGVTLWQNVDIQRLTRSPALRGEHVVPTALPPPPPVAAPRVFTAAMYFSRATARYFPDSTYYDGLVRAWEQLVRRLGGTVTRMSTPAEIAALDSTQLLLAPSALCLDSTERAALRGHADRGGGLLLTWATGARDRHCRWRGWDGVGAFTGALDVREIDRREALYLTVPAGLPLGAGLNPATRVEFRPEAQLALAVGGARIYWSDWALNAAPAGRHAEADAAAWMGRTDRGGRVVWFGFRMGQGATARDDAIIGRIFENGVRWGAAIPFAELAPWPQRAQAALLIAEDVESRFEHAVALADLARTKNAAVTFFAVSQMALDYPHLAAPLAAAGEIGSQTSDHQIVAGLPAGEQRARLQRTWMEVRRWTGDTVLGLRPPEERFDDGTLRAWRELGGSYLVAVNDARAGSPEIFATPAGEVVLLPRLLKDDYNVFVQESALRSRHLTEAYLTGMAKIRALGGLAVISVHTQIAGDPGRVGLLAEIIDSARAQAGWWMARGGDIAEWWMARWHARISMDTLSDGALEIVITAPARQSLLGATLDLMLHTSPSDCVPLVRGSPIIYEQTEWGLRIPVADLAPGAEQRVVVVRAEAELASRELQQHSGR